MVLQLFCFPLLVKIEAEYTSHSTVLDLLMTTQSIGFKYKGDGSLTIHLHFILITGNGCFAIMILFFYTFGTESKKLYEFDFNFPGFREKIKESGQRTGFSPKYFAV